MKRLRWRWWYWFVLLIATSMAWAYLRGEMTSFGDWGREVGSWLGALAVLGVGLAIFIALGLWEGRGQNDDNEES